MIGSNTTLSASNPGETEAIRNTSYYYNVKTAITSVISESFANMLIDSDNIQRLASSCVGAGSPITIWGMFNLYSNGDVVGNGDLYYSYGGENRGSSGVRPVVTLSSNVSLEWNSTSNQWEISNN